MRRYVVIFALVTLAVLAAWFFLVWSPLSNRISETAREADQAESKVRALQAEVQRLQALEREAPQLRERAAKADTAIPGDPQLAQFILQVQEAADSSGVDWVSVTPTPPAPLPEETTPAESRNVLEVAISISVEGGYFQVQDFITRLETLTRAVKVNSVSLNSGEPATRLEATLAMKMFVALPIPVVASPTTPTGAS